MVDWLWLLVRSRLYLKIFDANNNLIYQTGGIGSGEYVTGTSPSWSNINLSLINPPYTVEIWDTEAWDILDGLEDLIGIPLDIQVSDDDLLGTYEINLEDGDHYFNLTVLVVIIQFLQVLSLLVRSLIPRLSQFSMFLKSIHY